MKRTITTVLIMILILIVSTSVLAHGGNITGWKDKDSYKIIEKDSKFYGYHNKDGIRHYHEVKWNSEKGRWDIVDSDLYYDKNLNVTTLEELSKNEQETEKVTVEYVKGVDGDTAKFKINGEEITVRFLAVDTPESVHPTKEVEDYGVEASNFTKEKLKNAKRIELEFDNNSDKKDKYDRYLAWIWVDGELLQNLLIEEGLAKVAYLYGDYKYTSILQKNEKIAKEKGLNIWSNANYEQEKNEETNIIQEDSNSIQENNEQSNYIYELMAAITLIVVGTIIKLIKKRR